MRPRRRSSTLIERICAEVREPIAHALGGRRGQRGLRLPEGDKRQHLKTIADAARATLSLLDYTADLQRRAEASRWRSSRRHAACRR